MIDRLSERFKKYWQEGLTTSRRNIYRQEYDQILDILRSHEDGWFDKPGRSEGVADMAIQKAAMSLGSTDEWTDQETMIADFEARLAALRAENERLREALEEARPYVQGVYDQTAFTNAQHIPAAVLKIIDADLKSGEIRAESQKRPENGA